MNLIRATRFAKIGKMSRRTVSYWCKTGKLPAVRVGKIWYIKVREMLGDRSMAEVLVALQILEKE